MCEGEPNNDRDRAVKRNGNLIGHLLRRISKFVPAKRKVNTLNSEWQ